MQLSLFYVTSPFCAFLKRYKVSFLKFQQNKIWDTLYMYCVIFRDDTKAGICPKLSRDEEPNCNQDCQEFVTFVTMSYYIILRSPVGVYTPVRIGSK